MKKILFLFLVFSFVFGSSLKDSYIISSFRYFNDERVDINIKYNSFGKMQNLVATTEHYTFETDENAMLLSVVSYNETRKDLVEKINKEMPCMYDFEERLRYIANIVDIDNQQ